MDADVGDTDADGVDDADSVVDCEGVGVVVGLSALLKGGVGWAGLIGGVVGLVVDGGAGLLCVSVPESRCALARCSSGSMESTSRSLR